MIEFFEMTLEGLAPEPPERVDYEAEYEALKQEFQEANLELAVLKSKYEAEPGDGVGLYEWRQAGAQDIANAKENVTRLIAEIGRVKPFAEKQKQARFTGVPQTPVPSRSYEEATDRELTQELARLSAVIGYLRQQAKIERANVLAVQAEVDRRAAERGVESADE